jgi:hypothetical protein
MTGWNYNREKEEWGERGMNFKKHTVNLYYLKKERNP